MRESGLADTRGAREHDTAVLRQRGDGERELVVTPDERPAARVERASLADPASGAAPPDPTGVRFVLHWPALTSATIRRDKW